VSPNKANRRDAGSGDFHSMEILDDSGAPPVYLGSELYPGDWGVELISVCQVRRRNIHQLS